MMPLDEDRRVNPRAKSRITLGTAVAMLAFGGCGSSSSVESTNSTLVPALTATWPGIPADAFVVGSGIESVDPTIGSAIHLAKQPGTPFGSELSPLAIPYRDGLLYLAAPQGNVLNGGSLRFVGPSGDRVVDEGAASFAVNADGRIAIGRLNSSGSEIVVLDDMNATANTWMTSQQAVVALAWSQGRLLLLETFGDSGVAPNLLSIADLDEPRTVRNESGLLAISPDGRSLMVDSLDPKTGLNVALVVDSKTFEQTGALRLSDATSELMVGQAEWSADGVVATVWIDGEQQVAVFKAEGQDLVIAQAVVLPKEVSFGLVHPTWDADTDEVWGWAWDSRVRPSTDGAFPTAPYMLVTCSFTTSECVTEAVGNAEGQVSRVLNRSAPNDGEEG